MNERSPYLTKFADENAAAMAVAAAAAAAAAAPQPPLRRAPLPKIAAACPSLEKKQTFSMLSDISGISDVVGHFQAFSNVFGRLRMFSDVFS